MAKLSRNARSNRPSRKTRDEEASAPTPRAKKSSGPDNTRIVTGVCRSTFMRITALEEDKYGNRICRTGILIPKSDKKTVRAVKDAILAAAIKKLGAKGENIFKSRKLHNPLLDADKLADDPESSTGDESRGHWFLSAKAYKLPGVVNRHNERITDPDELDEICVSGYYFRFSLTFKGFVNESHGVRALLNNVMFVKEGERFDGGKAAEDEFEEYASDDEDDGDEWGDE